MEKANKDLKYTKDQVSQLKEVYGTIIKTFKLMMKDPGFEVDPHLVEETAVNIANMLLEEGYNCAYPGIVYTEDGDPSYIEEMWGPHSYEPKPYNLDKVYIFLEAVRRTGLINIFDAIPFIMKEFPDRDADTAKWNINHWYEVHFIIDYSGHENEIAEYTEKLHKMLKEA